MFREDFYGELLSKILRNCTTMLQLHQTVLRHSLVHMEYPLPRRVHGLLTACEHIPLHRCFHSPANTGLVLFNMAGIRQPCTKHAFPSLCTLPVTFSFFLGGNELL